MVRSETPSPQTSSYLDQAGQALFRLGRAFGRLPLRDLLASHAARGTELSAILVAQAVETLLQSGYEATVGGVAEQLSVDPSTASRLVAQSVQSGLLRRVPSRIDGRARGHELTASGQEMAEAAARYQRAVFAAATHDWSDAEREAFARLFVRFAEAIVSALNAERKAGVAAMTREGAPDG